MPSFRIELNCLIEGQGVFFPVAALYDDKVGKLKNCIKRQCALSFEGVDAHLLELWKVSAIDDSLCEITLLSSAQGSHRCRSRRDSC